jgi:hypothetical protein
MSFLEIGIFSCAAVIGVSLSALGVGLEPSWTWLFLGQMLASITIFPIIAFAVCVGIVNIVPERFYVTLIRASVPTVLFLTAATAIWSVTAAVTGPTTG